MKALIIFSFVPALAADLDQAEAQPSFGDQLTLTTSGRCATNSVALRLEWSQFYRGLTKGKRDRKCKYWANGVLKRAWRLVAGSFGRDAGYRNYGESINGLGGSLTRQLERLSPSWPDLLVVRLCRE
jgi:hypothetical protein